MSALSWFKLWVLLASQQLGIAALPVEHRVLPEAWAMTCNTCPERQFTVSYDLTCYGDRDFIKEVAIHEVCHVYMGHDGERVSALINKVGVFQAKDQLEKEANRCMIDVFGYTQAQMDLQDTVAERWWLNAGTHLKACGE